MSNQLHSRTRRTSSLMGVVLVVAAAIMVAFPAVPGARALDPTPAPEPSSAASAAPEPLAAATPEPSVAPDPSVAPEATAVPSVEPTAVPVASESPDASPVDPAPSTTPTPSDTPSATPSATPSPTPKPIGLRTGHAWFELLDADGRPAGPTPLDEPLRQVERYATYRVWFQVVNGTDVGVEIGPRLEWAAAGDGFAAVPAGDGVTGQPLFVSPAASGPDAVRVDTVQPGDLRLPSSIDPDGEAVDGLLSYGRNPTGGLTLPPHTYTEVGFVVHVTGDAAYQTTYLMRLTDGGVTLSGGVDASAEMGSAPVVDLSAGQEKGDVVGAAVPLYRLDLGFEPQADAGGFASPHFDLSLTSDTCAACHSSHTAKQAYRLGAAPTMSDTCFTCHDGTGALSNVQAEFDDPNVPANNPATGTWYSHPSIGDDDHTSDREDEFSGRLNRHASCADCHQPHLSDSSLGVQSTAGWTASGAIRGAAGVSVVNGAAGSAPAYTLTPTTTLEYQLCFKCHSGFTQLTAGARDKGVEFNPANTSYHPVEAAGKNNGSKMAASLAGTSPYKLWNFSVTGTVRCTHCHGNPRTREPGAPAADARQAPHSSQYEGLLIANYRREPLEQDEPYDAANFALCLTCHGEAGILGSTSQTEFNAHGLHIGDMEANGNASCAECHANSHSTADRNPAQSGTNSRLVVFGSTVSPYQGVLRWNKTGPSEGTCTLVCHGFNHNPENYRP